MIEALLRDFLGLLEEETRALIDGGVDQIDDIVRRKEAMFLRLQQSQAAPDFAEDARRLAEECRLRNLANGRLVARLRHSAMAQLAVLAGDTDPTESYGAGGTLHQSLRSRSLTAI